MNIPVEVSYRGVEKTEQLEELIEEQKEKLDKLSDRINSCRASVELDQKSRHIANVYRVRLDLTINHGNEIPVVEKTRPDDENPGVEPLVRRVFETARRQVIKLKERQNKDVKSHPDQSVRGIVKHKAEGNVKFPPAEVSSGFFSAQFGLLHVEGLNDGRVDYPEGE